MTVQELIAQLTTYAEEGAERHVVIALTHDYANHGKFEVKDVWCDTSGTLNIITGPSACKIDPELWNETDTPKPK